MRTLIAIALTAVACAGGPAPGRCAGSPDAGSAPGMVATWDDATGRHEIRATRLTCIDITGSGVVPRYECRDSSTLLTLSVTTGFFQTTPAYPVTWTDIYSIDVRVVFSTGQRGSYTPNDFVIRATEPQSPSASRTLRMTGSICRWSAFGTTTGDPGTATFNGLELVMPPGV